MADVRFIAVDSAGNSLGDLSAATSRSLEFNLDGPATAAFTMPSDHPQTNLVAELAVDVVVVRAGQWLFRGRIGSSADTVTADARTVNFTAIDYRGMLDRRILWSDSPLSFRQVDQGLIAWQMIADSQRRPGGNLGITQGVGVVTGIPRDRDYTPGQKIGEMITNLGDCDSGFDWEIDAHLAFNCYYPFRGRQTGIDLVFGQQVTGFQRNVTSTAYATALRYSGQQGLQAVEIADATFGPAGRWEAQIGDTNLLLQQTVQDHAVATLAASDTLVPGYALDLLAGWWTPANLWLGDSANLWLRVGRLDEPGTQMRVTGLKVVYDDAGGEAVSVSLGANPPSMTGRLGDYQSRIEVLERSATASSGYLPDAPVGAMYSWPGQTPPKTWAWADGTAYSTAAYPELFTVLGYTYGGSGGTFNVPDCRSRLLVAAGSGPGLTARSAGATGGAETVALDATATGVHSHPLSGLTTGQSGDQHTHGATGTGDANHTHPPGGGGVTGVPSVGHTHNMGIQPSVDAVAGTTAYGVTGGGTTGPDQQTHTHTLPTTGAASIAHIHATGNADATHAHSLTGQVTSAGGGGAPHENMPPWIAIGQIIRILPPWRPNP